jgi:hypothetical protein
MKPPYDANDRDPIEMHLEEHFWASVQPWKIPSMKRKLKMRHKEVKAKSFENTAAARLQNNDAVVNDFLNALEELINLTRERLNQ